MLLLSCLASAILHSDLTTAQPLTDSSKLISISNKAAVPNSHILFESLVVNGAGYLTSFYPEALMNSVQGFSPVGPSVEADAFSLVTLRMKDKRAGDVLEIHNSATGLYAWSLPSEVERPKDYLPWRLHDMDWYVTPLRRVLEFVQKKGYQAKWSKVSVFKERINPFDGDDDPEICYLLSGFSDGHEIIVMWGAQSRRIRRMETNEEDETDSVEEIPE